MIGSINNLNALYPSLDFSKKVSLSAATIYAGYTCPDNGMILGGISSNGSGTYDVQMCVSKPGVGSVCVARSYSRDLNESQVSTIVGKGDRFYSTTTAGYSVFPAIYFIPWKK